MITDPSTGVLDGYLCGRWETVMRVHEPAVMLGVAIGDALGARFEQWGEATEPPDGVGIWDGGFVAGHGLDARRAAGQWTDDAGMACALAEAILARGGFDAGSVMDAYVRWYDGVLAGAPGVASEALVGGTIREAIGRYRSCRDAASCGVEGSEGSGTAMRVAPLGLAYRHDVDLAMAVARMDAVLTHRSDEAQEGSAAVAGLVAVLSRGGVMLPARLDILLDVASRLRPSRMRQALTNLAEDLRGRETLDRILLRLGVSGHVLHVVPGAAACFFRTTSFEAAVVSAVRGASAVGGLCGDADTRASIAGAFAGAYHGLRGVPERYRTGVDRGEQLVDIDRRLVALHANLIPLDAGLTVPGAERSAPAPGDGTRG